MAINVSEALLSLPVAAGLIPCRAGHPVTHVTVWRWATVGLHRRDGAVVKLETITVGKRLFPSAEALKRFRAALDAPLSQQAEMAVGA